MFLTDWFQQVDTLFVNLTLPSGRLRRETVPGTESPGDSFRDQGDEGKDDKEVIREGKTYFRVEQSVESSWTTEPFAPQLFGPRRFRKTSFVAEPHVTLGTGHGKCRTYLSSHRDSHVSGREHFFTFPSTSISAIYINVINVSHDLKNYWRTSQTRNYAQQSSRS